MMQIHWQDRITNQEILNRAGSVCTEAMIFQAQLHWFSHITCMDETRITMQLFCGELASGSYKKGHLKKRHKDNLKSCMKWAETQPKQFEPSASDRSNWQALVRKASINFEEDHYHCLAVAHDCSHRAASASIPAAGISYPTCTCICASVFGLRSHMWTHH